MILPFLYYLRLRGLVVYGTFLRLVRRSAWLFADLSCCPVFLFEIGETFRFIAIKPKLRKNQLVSIIHKLDLPEPLSWLTATIVLKSDKNLSLRKSLMLCWISWRFCCLSSVRLWRPGGTRSKLAAIRELKHVTSLSQAEVSCFSL